MAYTPFALAPRRTIRKKNTTRRNATRRPPTPKQIAEQLAVLRLLQGLSRPRSARRPAARRRPRW